MPLLTILGITGGAGGGGGGGWNPSELNNPIGVYEMFDDTALFGPNYAFVAGGTWPKDRATGYWTPFSSGGVGVIADKSGLLAAGVTYGTFEAMCLEHGGDVTVPLNTTTGWTLGTGWSIDTMAETLDCDGTTAGSFATYTVPSSYVVDGAWYRVQFRFTCGVSDDIGVTLGDAHGSADRDPGAITNGYANMLIYSQGVDELSIESGLIAFTGSIWDISIQAVPGNHIYMSTDMAIATDGSGVKYAQSVAQNNGLTPEGDMDLPAHISVACLYRAISGNQTEPYATVWAIEDNTNGDFLLLGGDSNNDGAVYNPSLWINGTGYEELWDNNATDTTLRFIEVDYDTATDAYALYRDDASVTSGTASTQSISFGSNNGQLNFVANAVGIPVSSEGRHDVYALYIYEGARDADLFSYVNSNTGEQI